MVVDSSALIPFVLPEAQTPFVRPVLDQPVEAIAPELILGELANALWVAERVKRLHGVPAPVVFAAARARLQRLAPLAPLAERALELALAHDHPAYDCFYVALAERERLPLVTCDRRLAETFAAVADIRLLGPAPPPAAPKPGRRR